MNPSEASKKLEFHSKQICHGCMHPSMVGWCENYCQLPEALKMAISALKKLEQDRWIPVTERLPEKDCQCRVTEGEGDFKYVFDCHWSNCKKQFEVWSNYYNSYVTITNVRAWKPIEEPYTGEES